jgi:DNA-binding MarR family transcriptional regulator
MDYKELKKKDINLTPTCYKILMAIKDKPMTSRDIMDSCSILKGSYYRGIEELEAGEYIEQIHPEYKQHASTRQPLLIQLTEKGQKLLT